MYREGGSGANGGKSGVEKGNQFQELIQSKELILKNYLVDREITASKYLIDILLNNLFSNAIRHNYQKGQIEIVLSKEKLIIKNTGDENALIEAQIFDRFQKGNASQGTGLGLALAKNICVYYGFDIQYAFLDNWHVFTVNFSGKA